VPIGATRAGCLLFRGRGDQHRRFGACGARRHLEVGRRRHGDFKTAHNEREQMYTQLDATLDRIWILLK
jgi:hypothetical protein